jgi:hypothetical protein
MDKPRKKLESSINDSSVENDSKEPDYEMIKSTSKNGASSARSESTNITRKKRPFTGREVNMRFFIGEQHTSPNKRGIVQVNKMTRRKNGINDIVKYYVGEVDEYLRTWQKGILEPPDHSTHEEHIKYRFRDRPANMNKDQARNAILCENSEGPDFSADSRLNRQTPKQVKSGGSIRRKRRMKKTRKNTPMRRK